MPPDRSIHPVLETNIEGYEWTGVAMGCIDTRLSISIAKHTFVGDKGGYYEINDGAPQHPAY